MTNPPTIPLRLRWRKTWPDYDDDFVADSPVPDVMIGRIMVAVGGPKNGQWHWTYQASIKGLPWAELDRSGFEPTARDAAKVIEDTWYRVTAGKRFDPTTLSFVSASEGEVQALSP